MKIMPNITKVFNIPASSTNNKKQPVNNVINNIQTINSTDSISFCSAHKVYVDTNLKKLLQYKIPDIYSDVILIDSQTLETAMKKKLFSGSIKNVIKFFQQHENSLFPVEKEVLNIIKRASNKQPKKNLAQIIHELFPHYNKQLMAEQKPVFEKLIEMSENLEPNLKTEFDALIKLYTDKMLHKSVRVPFSAKEFNFKEYG